MLSNEELRENLKRLGLTPPSDQKRMIHILKKHLQYLAKEPSQPPQPWSCAPAPPSQQQRPSPITGNRPRTPLYKVSLPPSPTAESSRSQEPGTSSSHAPPSAPNLDPPSEGQSVEIPVVKSEKHCGKRPEGTPHPTAPLSLGEDFDLWSVMEPPYADEEESDVEYDEFAVVEDNKVFLERLNKLNALYDSNKLKGISYGRTTVMLHAGEIMVE